MGVRLGLVLEGGSMRGMFTAGVLDVFMENGIHFDGAAGVSAGAVFGCNIKSGQAGRVIRYNKRFCNDKRYAGIGNWLKTGNIFGTDFCYNKIVNELDVFDAKAFKENPMEFFAVCTDASTGKAVYLQCREGDAHDVLLMRASASLPVVSKLVKADGRLLSDGGIADSVPIRFMEERGYRKNVVVLTQPLGYRKRPMRVLPVVRLFLHRYPNLTKSIKNRWSMYNSTLDYIAEREKAGEVFVIRPPEALNIKVIERNPENLERVYRLGRAEAQAHLDEIIRFEQNT